MYSNIRIFAHFYPFRSNIISVVDLGRVTGVTSQPPKIIEKNRSLLIEETFLREVFSSMIEV